MSTDHNHPVEEGWRWDCPACPESGLGEELGNPDPAQVALKAHRAVLDAQARMARLSRERDADVRAALESGTSAAQLAELLGITRQRIHTMARKGKE